MPNQMQVKPFSIDNRALFESQYKKQGFPLAEHSVNWLYLWQDTYKNMRWCRINSNICLFVDVDGKTSLWNSVFPGKNIPDTLRQLQEIEDFASVTYIPNQHLHLFENLENSELIYQNQDYIYRTSDIMNFPGSAYAKKRNSKSQFSKSYNYSLEEYDRILHEDGCLALLRLWRLSKEDAVSEEDMKKIDEEDKANRLCLKQAHALGLKGIIVKVDGIVQGYSFAEKTNGQMATIFFEKTNPHMRGLSAFIFSEMAGKFAGTEYINAGEDWDVEYIKSSKLSYHPVFLNKSYTLVRTR